jgi:hypothetical protein
MYLQSVKKYIPLRSVWIAFFLGIAVGFWIGKYFWGWRAVLRISQVAHNDLMGRAGLRGRRR